MAIDEKNEREVRAISLFVHGSDKVLLRMANKTQHVCVIKMNDTCDKLFATLAIHETQVLRMANNKKNINNPT